MKRREFLVALATLALAPARAQGPARTGRVAQVGIYLTSPPETLQQHYVRLFIQEMAQLGWTEGSTVAYDRAYATRDLRWPDHKVEMNAIAKALVERKPDVIWLASSSSATAMLDVTRTIPVVGSAVSEVVERGFAKSLARPGGNFTGISNFAWELGAKRFQLLHEMVPKLARVAVLMHPRNANTLREVKAIEAVAAPARVTIVRALMEREDQINAAFDEIVGHRAEAVLIAHLPLYQNARKAILRRAAQERIPVVGHRTFFAEDGALMAYSTVLDEQMRRSAYLVDKILKGANPGDIPVEQPTKFELVINRRTASTLGLTIPPRLLIQADRIID
jgi:putative tryptophan/tyrosine transport system substrate-binding protein